MSARSLIIESMSLEEVALWHGLFGDWPPKLGAVRAGCARDYIRSERTRTSVVDKSVLGVAWERSNLPNVNRR
jgi:hypothetical protein